VDFTSYLDQVRLQAAALRTAAVAAGPDAAVPTCPDWDVRQLVRHIARVHNWVVQAFDTDPAGAAPSGRPTLPDGWEDTLTWWDAKLDAMIAGLERLGPDGPAWTFGDDGTAGFWARRQAHETAIHRLDAEHALAGSGAASAVPTLVFEPGFAADGVDEAMLMIARRMQEERSDATGTVLFHAADAGRAWLVTLEPGAAPEIGPADVIDTDASVVGTADAVYRAAWRRPSTAVVGGDRAVLEALRTP
jgi:uncharacterized protein (TIGR03083 family)